MSDLGADAVLKYIISAFTVTIIKFIGLKNLKIAGLVL